jgi:hypothetical protein
MKIAYYYPNHACLWFREGKGLFDLEQQKNTIKTELNLPSDVRLFCSKEGDASLGQNSLENHYTSVSKNTFIRAENDEGCYGTDNLT